MFFGMKPGTFNSIGVSTRERINEFSLVVDVFVSVTVLVQVEVAFSFICYDQGSPMDLLDDRPHECVVAPFIIFAFHHEQLSVTLLKYPLSDDSFTAVVFPFPKLTLVHLHYFSDSPNLEVLLVIQDIFRHSLSDRFEYPSSRLDVNRRSHCCLQDAVVHRVEPEKV